MPRNTAFSQSGIIAVKVRNRGGWIEKRGRLIKMQYRNVFREIGISEEEIAERRKEIVHTFFYDNEEKVYHPVGDDMAYIEDTGNHDARTEGMSYGMMMCVQLDMKEEFDRLWKWAKTYMWMDAGENEGYFAWSCAPDGSKNAYGPAPDGEEFFAMALFFASHRWGDGEGIFQYEKEARDILSACLHKGENGRAGEPMWNRGNCQILFVPGSSFTDPSYHLPHFYELFAKWANEEDRGFGQEQPKPAERIWRRHAMRIRECRRNMRILTVLRSTRNLSGGSTDIFIRTLTAPRQISDWITVGMESTRDSAPRRKELQYFLGVTRRENPYMTYRINGEVIDQSALHPVGMLATTAQGTLAVLGRLDEAELSDSQKLAREWTERFFREPMRKGERRYYDNCLYLFAYLALSGSYRVW